MVEEKLRTDTGSIAISANQLGTCICNSYTSLNNGIIHSVSVHDEIEYCKPIIKTSIIPKLIKQIGNKTFVTWSDGTENKVKCEYGKPFDPFSAFCIAFTKHVLGSTTKILEAIESADETVLKQKEAEAKRLQHEKRTEEEKEKFKKDVEKKRYELAVLRKAEQMLATDGKQ